MIDDLLSGDLNSDSVVDVLDIVSLVNIILVVNNTPSDCELDNADFNNDVIADIGTGYQALTARSLSYNKTNTIHSYDTEYIETAKHFLSNTAMWKKWVPADVAEKVVASL